MLRCPLCGSALVTIVLGLYPLALCATCGARWTQDGDQQRLLDRVHEPSLMAPGPLRAWPRRSTSHLGHPAGRFSKDASW
jgi:Zn-finger nucleic acid-binding protein